MTTPSGAPDRGCCAGRMYLERGEPVVVLVGWRQTRPVLHVPGVTTRPTAPRNVLVERADGTRVVRPFRGLRRLA